MSTPTERYDEALRRLRAATEDEHDDMLAEFHEAARVKHRSDFMRAASEDPAVVDAYYAEVRARIAAKLTEDR